MLVMVMSYALVDVDVDRPYGNRVCQPPNMA